MTSDRCLANRREFPIAKILRFLTAREVSRRIGMTTGVFYHHFPSQQEYCEALLARLFDPEVAAGLLPPPDACERMIGDGPDISDPIDALCAHQQRVVTDPSLRLLVWLAARRGAEPSFDEVLRDHNDVFDEIYGAFCEEHLARVGRRIAPPYEARDVAVLINCLADGLTLRDGSEAPARARLYSFVVATMLEGLSVPIDSDETFESVVERLTDRRSDPGAG